MLNAKRLHDGLQMALGDTRIEDLWINTFAVGTIIYEHGIQAIATSL